MTRILYWNVNNFSRPKIFAAGPPAVAQEAADRLAYMVTNVLRGPVGGPIPDIIVIVEVFSRVREVGAEGTVLNPVGNAGSAVLVLRDQIRNDPVLGAAGTNWSVVPPLNLGEFGQREAVAVYYNAAQLHFTGPNLYWTLYGPPGTIVGQSQPVTPATFAQIAAYPGAWPGALPNRAVNFPLVGNIAENQLAGEWQYYAAFPPRVVPSPAPPQVPNNRLQYPDAGCRGPFHTRFADGAGRSISLFTVHTSPTSASAAVTRLGQTPDIKTAPAANEVKVVLGDFNVDTFQNGGFQHANTPYGGLLQGPGAIYIPQLDPGVLGQFVAASKPYCMTHLLPTASATPYNNVGVPADEQHNVYPRYGFMGSTFPALNDAGAIDNAFTAHGVGAGAAANITVVNTLTSTPYSRYPRPPAVPAALTNGRPFASSLPINILTGGAAPPGGVIPSAFGQFVMEPMFRSWHFFGKVYSTSDHLALMVDV